MRCVNTWKTKKRVKKRDVENVWKMFFFLSYNHFSSKNLSSIYIRLMIFDNENKKKISLRKKTSSSFIIRFNHQILLLWRPKKTSSLIKSKTAIFSSSYEYLLIRIIQIHCIIISNCHHCDKLINQTTTTTKKHWCGQ